MSGRHRSQNEERGGLARETHRPRQRRRGGAEEKMMRRMSGRVTSLHGRCEPGVRRRVSRHLAREGRSSVRLVALHESRQARSLSADKSYSIYQLPTAHARRTVLIRWDTSKEGPSATHKRATQHPNAEVRRRTGDPRETQCERREGRRACERTRAGGGAEGTMAPARCATTGALARSARLRPRPRTGGLPRSMSANSTESVKRPGARQ